MIDICLVIKTQTMFKLVLIIVMALTGQLKSLNKPLVVKADKTPIFTTFNPCQNTNIYSKNKCLLILETNKK